MILKTVSARLSRFCWKIAVVAIAALGLQVDPALSTPLLPNTKIRLSLVQWMPTKGNYEQWATVGGEYTVSDERTISVPLLGLVSVENKDPMTLASAIAMQLKEKIGLVDVPIATIEILSYPPIYVVGEVANPGEYQFHTGVTVLQALAMGGGQRRAPDTLQSSLDVTRLVGDLREIDDAIIRSAAKIERLEAEMAGEKSLKSQPANANKDPFASAIYKQEEVIFSSRANELERQSKSISGLRDLLGEEVSALQEKMKSTDANIASVQQQLESTMALIERGAIVATKQAEVERTIRTYQNERLDLNVAIMQARQNITQATRDLEGLYDRRQTEVASQLQAERATMTQLKLKRDTSQKLLMDNLAAASSSARSVDQQKLQYSIVRNAETSKGEIEALETTVMMPGDVLKVVLRGAPPQALEPPPEGTVNTTPHNASQ